MEGVSEPAPACFAKAGASVFANGEPANEQTKSGKAVNFSAESRVTVAIILRRHKQATRQEMGLQSPAEARFMSFYYNSASLSCQP